MYSYYIYFFNIVYLASDNEVADVTDENEDSNDEAVDLKDDLSSDEAVDSTTYDVYDYDEFTAALDEIISSEVDQNYTINPYSDSWRQQYESTGSVKWGESGQLVHNLTINGNGITIDLNEDEFIFVSAGYTVTITNITLINGCTDASSALVHSGLTGYGGALFNEGNLTLDNVIVADNYATSYGGAIYNRGTLTITNSTFDGNEAKYEGGVIASMGNLTISDSTFINNKAESYGVLINMWGNVSIVNSSFISNANGTLYNR